MVAHDDVWPTFDGWCASQNVAPFEIEWSRFLNLVYYFLTRNIDKEGKQKVDSEIAHVNAQWALEQMASTRGNALRAAQSDEQPVSVPEPTPSATSERRRRLPPPPPGWGTPEENYRSSMAAAKSLKVGDGTRRPKR